MSAPLLEAAGLCAGYGEADVLTDVALAVPAGALVCVIGPNGAGKSTLLKALYRLVPPRRGTVTLADEGGGRRDLAGLRPHQLTALGLNYVPQLANVFASLTVRENLEVGGGLDRRRLAARLERTYDAFPELRDRARQRAGTLSGGQRQTLALARALMPEPRLLLLDEPSAGLSAAAVDRMFERLAAVRASGVTILMVEQNARRSLALADHAYVLDMGRNRFEGPGPELLERPEIAELYLGGLRPRPVSLRRTRRSARS